MMVKSDLEKKANFTFYQIFGLGASFLVLTLLLSVKLYILVGILYTLAFGAIAFFLNIFDKSIIKSLLKY